MLSAGLMLVAALTTVPPGEWPINNNQPCHGGYPVIRRFERKPEDDFRRCNWEAFVRQLDLSWEAYRRSNSTPEAFCQYKEQLNELRREYVYRDPYLVAVPPVEEPVDLQWSGDVEGDGDQPFDGEHHHGHRYDGHHYDGHHHEGGHPQHGPQTPSYEEIGPSTPTQAKTVRKVSLPRSTSSNRHSW